MTRPVPPVPDGPGLFVRLEPRPGENILFSIDGVPAEARAGDLVLSAILLHRPALRRFEFGPEDRAGFCLMGACQDCWVWTEAGERLRACTTPAQAGLRIVTGPGPWPAAS